jgi:hypothetical protein
VELISLSVFLVVPMDLVCVCVLMLNFEILCLCVLRRLVWLNCVF